MNFKPIPYYKGPSYLYKKRRILWLNSSFNSGFTLIDNKVYDVFFDLPPFQIYKNSNLKVLTYIRDSNQARPIVIKLKDLNFKRNSVINTDNEYYPVIYSNHTGVEGMTFTNNPSIILIPQQIPRITLRLDDNYNSFLSSSGSSVSYRIFNYTGTIQTFNIPDGVSSVNVYCWGGGGGSTVCVSGLSNTYIPARGGNGGFVKATLIIPQGTTSLAVIVGQGGRKGVINSLSGKSFGGGGDGHAGNISWAIGGGGGLSGIFVNDANMTIVSSYQVNTNATPFIISGGGGGAGGADALQNTSPNHGGNGGSDNGNDSSYSVIGGGGTQTTGGSGSIGNEGAKYRGGNAGNYSAGGGSGWFGGGTRNTPGNFVGGGGGGSSYINTGSYKFTNINNLKTITNGTATVEGDKETYYQSGIGLGAPITNTTQGLIDGGNGLVVIEYFRSRIEGVTAQETLIQTTNTSIDVNTNSKYVINYQTPVNIPKGTYESIFANGAITFKSKPDYSYPTTYKNPIVWYKFDGSQFLYDSSYNNNLINSGAVLDTNNFIRGNGSLSVSQNKVAKIGGANINLYSIQTTNGISFSVWFRATSSSQYGRVFEFMNNAPPENYSVIMDFPNSPTTNNLRIYIFNTPTYVNYTTSGINFCDGNWRHIVWTISSSGVWSFYINGVNQNINITANVPNSLDLNYSRVLGGSFDGSLSYIIGNIDDFRIFDYVLSPVEVYELYNGNTDRSYPVLKDANVDTINPLAWYKFDIGNLLVDSSGNSYTLTNNGTVTINQNDFVKGNGSVSFTSSSQWLNNSSFLNLSSRSWSISFWVKKTNNLTIDYLIKIGSGGASYQTFVMYFDATNKFIVSNYNSTVETPSFSVANRWVHICFTYLTGTKRGSIYRDGVQIVQGTYNGEVSVDTNLYIGSLASVTVDNLKGSLDDVRIYQQELTATQVSELYNGRIGIYSPPSFILGLELEDE